MGQALLYIIAIMSGVQLFLFYLEQISDTSSQSVVVNESEVGNIELN